MNNEYGQCTVCEAPKQLIHRRLVLTTGDHRQIDEAQFCERCWDGYKSDILDGAILSDSEAR